MDRESQGDGGICGEREEGQGEGVKPERREGWAYIKRRLRVKRKSIL
jgi:hypothetical protein